MGNENIYEYSVGGSFSAVSKPIVASKYAFSRFFKIFFEIDMFCTLLRISAYALYVFTCFPSVGNGSRFFPHIVFQLDSNFCTARSSKCHENITIFIANFAGSSANVCEMSVKIVVFLADID